MEERKKAVSKYSPKMIGLSNEVLETRNHRLAKYREEGMVVSDILSGIHHTRKIPYMEVQYPTTITKLSNYDNITRSAPDFRRRDHQETSREQFDSKTKIPPETREAAVLQRMNYNVRSAHDFNERRMRYNQKMGTRAVVNEIISGKAPLPKDILFPQNASHQQVLVLTDTLKMPNPNIEPPPLSRPKKWLGNDIGWES